MARSGLIVLTGVKAHETVSGQRYSPSDGRLTKRARAFVTG